MATCRAFQLSYLSRSIFDFVPPPKLFGVCYSTVHTVTKEKVGDSDIAGSVPAPDSAGDDAIGSRK